VIRRIEFPGSRPGNPLVNALVIAGGALVFAALVLFSLLAFLVVAGLVALLAAVIGVRTWWLRRRRPGTPRPRATGEVIEGEYRRVPTRGDERHAGD